MYRSNVFPELLGDRGTKLSGISTRDRLINSEVFLAEEFDVWFKSSQLVLTCKVDCNSNGARPKASSNQDLAFRDRLVRISLRI